MTFHEITLRVPGLDRAYTFMHLSDLHISHAYPEDDEETKAQADRQLVRWRSSKGVLPDASLEEALAECRRLHPDALLIAGDGVDYFSPSGVRYLGERLATAGVPYVYAYGNHEGEIHTKALYPAYAPLMGGDPAVHVLELGGLRIIAVDDSNETVSDAQLDTLRELFGEAIPTVILLHIPLCTPELEPSVMRIWGPTFMVGTADDPENAHTLCRLCKDPASPVVAVFAGHIHYAHNSELIPGRMQIVSPPCHNNEGNITRLLPC